LEASYENPRSEPPLLSLSGPQSSPSQMPFAIAPLRECFSNVHLIATLVIVPLVVQKIDARVEGFVCKLGCEEC